MGIDRWFVGGMVVGSVALACLRPAHAQQPFACSIASKAAASVMHEGTPKSPPLGLDNCDGVAVVRGEVIVTVLSPEGRRRSATFGAGATVTSAALFGSQAPRPGGLWLSVLDVLRAPAQSQTLGTRGAARPIAPEGECLGLDKTLRFDFGSLPVVAFELREAGPSGRLVTRTTTITHPIEVQTRRVQRGAEYVWSAARSEGAALQGRFHLTHVRELGKVRAALADVDADPGLDRGGRALVKAEWLKKNGLAYDAVEQLRREGFDVAVSE
jgi:hypothetical protein